MAEKETEAEKERRGLTIYDLTPKQLAKFKRAFPDYRKIFGISSPHRNPTEEEKRGLHNTLVQMKGRNWTTKELRGLVRFGGPDNWEGVGKIPDTSGLKRGIYYTPSTDTVLEVEGKERPTGALGPSKKKTTRESVPSVGSYRRVMTAEARESWHDRKKEGVDPKLNDQILKDDLKEIEEAVKLDEDIKAGKSAGARGGKVRKIKKRGGGKIIKVYARGGGVRKVKK